MTPRIFAGVAEKNGAAVAFDGGGTGDRGDVDEMRRRSSRSTSLLRGESLQAEINAEINAEEKPRRKKSPPPPPPTPPEAQRTPSGSSLAFTSHPLSLAPAPAADTDTPPHIATPWPAAKPEDTPPQASPASSKRQSSKDLKREIDEQMRSLG